MQCLTGRGSEEDTASAGCSQAGHIEHSWLRRCRPSIPIAGEGLYVRIEFLNILRLSLLQGGSLGLTHVQSGPQMALKSANGSQRGRDVDDLQRTRSCLYLCAAHRSPIAEQHCRAISTSEACTSPPHGTVIDTTCFPSNTTLKEHLLLAYIDDAQALKPTGAAIALASPMNATSHCNSF